VEDVSGVPEFGDDAGSNGVTGDPGVSGETTRDAAGPARPAGTVGPAGAAGDDAAPALAPRKGAVVETERQARRAEVIAIFGPTASGKSAVAEAVANRLGTEIVSADAMQVYRGLPILTNQPAAPTRLVAIRSLDETMSVGAFAALAHAEIDALVGQRGVAVVAGGTGLYLRAALADLRVPPPAADDARARIRREVERDRMTAHDRLSQLDPAAGAAVHPHDTKRLVRALELAEVGRSLVPGQDRLWSGPVRRPTRVFGLDLSPSLLEERIRRRTEDMFARGVVDEVRSALAGHVSQTAEKTLGLSEIAGLEPHEALERIVMRTRRYAAYQRKWMRRIPDLVLLDGSLPSEQLAAEIVAEARR
jgi:tRNA dimethylallyltransferase